MKTIFHANVNGHEVVLGFGLVDGFIDPEATREKVAPAIADLERQRQSGTLTQADFEAAYAKLIEANAVYTGLPQGTSLIVDMKAQELAEKFNSRKNGQLLCVDGTMIEESVFAALVPTYYEKREDLNLQDIHIPRETAEKIVELQDTIAENKRRREAEK